MSHYPLLSVSMLQPDPKIQELYPPHTAEQLNRLKDHVRQFGIMTPLIVRPANEHFLIVDGATRHAIALELGIPAVPCLICESELEVLAATFLNVHRRQLDPDTHARLLKHEQEQLKALKPRLTEPLVQLLERFPLHTVPPFNNKSFWWGVGIGPQELQIRLTTNLQAVLNDYAKSHANTIAPDPKLLDDRNRLAKKVHEYQSTIDDLHAQLSSLREQLEARDATLAAWTAPDRIGNRAVLPETDLSLINRFLRTNLDVIVHALHTLEEYFTQEFAGAIDSEIWKQLGQIHKRIDHLVDKGQLLPPEFKLRLIQGGSDEPS